MKYLMHGIEICKNSLEFELVNGVIELVSAMFIDRDSHDGLGDYLDNEELVMFMNVYGIPDYINASDFGENEALSLHERNS